MSRTTTRSAAIRAALHHPVLDADGHWLEPVPIYCDFLRDVAGPRMVDRYLRLFEGAFGRWYELTPERRLAQRQIRPPFMASANGALDRATAMMPALLYERLDELGIDFSIVYSSIGLFAGSVAEEDLRRAYVRALNRMNSEMFAPYSDRLTPVATVAAVTPDEAIDELTYVRETLGMKTMMLTSPLRRPIEAYSGKSSDVPAPYYVDSLLDGPYDYDPLWAKAVELGIAVTMHTGGVGWPDRMSPTNFVYNHIGHFAAGAHAAAKGVFLAGVPRRFPALNFAFQEGGAGWAASLYLDLGSHWQKRNVEALRAAMTPGAFDTDLFQRLIERYAGKYGEGRLAELAGSPSPWFPGKSMDEMIGWEPTGSGPMGIDDFEALEVASEDELKTLFRDHFYFGCEPDDPTTTLAFDKRLGLDLRAMFSSDIGHFDVPDMSRVLEEAYELVEHGLLDDDDFRKFTFTNAAELHAGMNPEFFAGTVLEAAVAELGVRPAPASSSR
jgi:predicted TIM-barrel fold metal-dependent hydrolase